MALPRALALAATAALAAAQTVFLVAPFNSSAALGANSSNWITHGTWTPRIVNEPAQVPVNALRLAPAANELYGAIEYANKMPTSMGIDVSATIAMWGGGGADGLIFYLRDGRDTAKVFGAPGGALAYTPRTFIPGYNVPGMSSALLGVGFDVVSAGPAVDCALARPTVSGASPRASHGRAGGHLTPPHVHLTPPSPRASHPILPRSTATSEPPHR